MSALRAHIGLLMAAAANTTEARRELRAAVVMYWDLAGSLADSARTSQTWSGSGASYGTGPSGAANTALLSGGSTDDKFVINTVLGYNGVHPSQPFSIGGMVRRESLSQDTYVWSVTTSGVSILVSLWVDQTDDKLKLKIGSQTVSSTATIADTTAWHGLVATIDGTNLRLYIDRALDSTHALTATSIGGTVDRFYLGDPASVGGDLSADLAHVFYAHACLSADAISYLYNNGSGRAYSAFSTVAYGTDPDTFAQSLGLQGYWKCNESSGTTAADSSGGGLGNAALTGGAAFINTLDPPPGFSTADYVVDCDGTNDYINIADLNYSSGSLSDTVFCWVYNDAQSAGETYWRAGTGTNNANHERQLNVAGTVTNVTASMFNATGSVLGFGSGGGKGATGAWRCHAHYYDDTGKVILSVSQGIANAGAVCSASPSAVNLDEVAFMSRMGSSAAISLDGKLSRCGIRKGGVVPLASLTKLFDLGTGSG
jgi:hypothetical protein